jgi:hypothetical protein
MTFPSVDLRITGELVRIRRVRFYLIPSLKDSLILFLAGLLRGATRRALVLGQILLVGG